MKHKKYLLQTQEKDVTPNFHIYWGHKEWPVNSAMHQILQDSGHFQTDMPILHWLHICECNMDYPWVILYQDISDQTISGHMWIVSTACYFVITTWICFCHHNLNQLQFKQTSSRNRIAGKTDLYQALDPEVEHVVQQYPLAVCDKQARCRKFIIIIHGD